MNAISVVLPRTLLAWPFLEVCKGRAGRYATAANSSGPFVTCCFPQDFGYLTSITRMPNALPAARSST